MSKKQKKQKMTRKEALAVLHQIYDAVGWHLYSEDASEEEKVLRAQVYTALQILDVAFYGEHVGYSDRLCNFCYLRMSIDDLHITAKGKYSRSCCATCLEQLKAEQKIERIREWDGTQWVEREGVH